LNYFLFCFLHRQAHFFTVPASAHSGSSEKWVSNYVPYEGFPKGEANSPSAAEEEGQKDEDSKWKKNYVAYEEGEGNSKKQEG